MANGFDINQRLQEVQQRVQDVRPNLLQQARESLQARGGRPRLASMVRDRIEDARPNVLGDQNTRARLIQPNRPPKQPKDSGKFRGMPEEPSPSTSGGFRGVT